MFLSFVENNSCVRNCGQLSRPPQHKTWARGRTLVRQPAKNGFLALAKKHLDKLIEFRYTITEP